MAYPYYAPFYRPTYYDQGQNPNMGQFNQQFQQPMPQQMQPVQMSVANPVSSDFLWVLNENEATSYPVAPNNTVTLWDKNLPTIYIKSVNSQGVPSMRVLDFVERTATNPAPPMGTAFNLPSNFVTLDSFNALKGDVEALRGKLDELKPKNTPKTKKTEVECDE
jgi:hypothetical protein